MSISIESRVHRTLRKLDRYRPCDCYEDLPYMDGLVSPLGTCEILFGAYENVTDSMDRCLLFTNLGIWWFTEERWSFVSFSEVTSVEWPSEGKINVRELTLKTKSGRRLVPVLGGTENTRDVFEVMRFVDRVVDDQKSLKGALKEMLKGDIA